MRSDKRSFGCVEYTIIIALCAILGFILYASLQYNPRETHTTSQPSQTTETSNVLHQPSSNLSIGNKMGHVKGATMGSAISATLGAAITTVKPTHHSIHYIPIHLHTATRMIRIIPEGQEAD